MGAPKVILVIEDDRAIQEVLTWCFTGEGYAVRRGSGDSALASALADPPNLIILDLWMTGETGGFMSAGEYILNTIRHHKVLKHTPVIVVTARRDLVGDALLLGANRVLSKPFDILELSRLVNAAIGPPTEAKE